MEINRRDFITKVSAIAALSVLPSSFVAAMGNEKVEKAKPKYPTLKCDVVVVGAGPGGVPAAIAAARQGAKVISHSVKVVYGEHYFAGRGAA